MLLPEMDHKMLNFSCAKICNFVMTTPSGLASMATIVLSYPAFYGYFQSDLLRSFL